LKTPDDNKQSLKEKNRNFKSPLWRSVFALVGLLTLNSLTLYFVWLLSVTYNSQMKKGDLMVLVVFQHNH